MNGAPVLNKETLSKDLERVELLLKEFEAGMVDDKADPVLKANKSRLDHFIKVAREKYSALRDTLDKE